MGLSSNVLAIGPFKENIIDCMYYDSKKYLNIFEGTIVVVPYLFSCNSSSDSFTLAKLLGVDVWNFNTHHIIFDKIDWKLLKVFNIEDSKKIEKLLENNFNLFFLPNR